MMTFQLIINKIFKIENNNFFTNIDGIDSTIRIYFALNNIINDQTIPLYKRKFELLQNISESFMVKYHKQEECIFYFNKIQRVYHVLNRFIYKYKIRKSLIVVNTDMILNPLKEDDKNVICIYHENSRYLFKIYDLLKIINISLINSQDFFANPLCIKNPYNNLPFGKNILYYIYHFIIEKTNIASNINYTELFFKFHRCYFNLSIFLNKYEYLLREHSIINYAKNSISDILYKDIKTMLLFYNSKLLSENKIYIDNEFPKATLITIFTPYLLLFMNSKFLLVPTLKYKAACELEKKLKEFQKFNPLFGRNKIKYIKKSCLQPKNSANLISEINSKHIQFYKYNNDSFLKDHLSYSYTHYYEQEQDDEEQEQDDEEQEQEEQDDEEQEQEEQDDEEQDDEEQDNYDYEDDDDSAS